LGSTSHPSRSRRARACRAARRRARPLRAPGCDRRLSRTRAYSGGDRLDTHHGALRCARPAHTVTRRGAESRGRVRHGVRSGGGTAPIASLLGIAGVLETFGGVLLLVGLFTRSVAFLLSGEMAFAYFIGHAPHGFWPLLNQGAPAVFYCFLFLYLSAAGAGPWSLDAKRGKSRLDENPKANADTRPKVGAAGSRRTYVCRQCGFVGLPDWKVPGSIAITLILVWF